MAETVRVADLLPERIEGLGTAARQTLYNDAKVAGQQLAWGYVSSHLEQALRKALDCDLFAVLASGWANSPLLNSYSAAMTQSTAEIQLGPHQLTRELHPTVAVTIGPCPCIELEFTLALAAQFSGLKLDIANRHLTGGMPGEVSASAQLSWGRNPAPGPVALARAARPFPLHRSGNSDRSGGLSGTAALARGSRRNARRFLK